MRPLYTQTEHIRIELDHLIACIDALIEKAYDTKLEPEKMRSLFDQISRITHQLMKKHSKCPMLNKWIMQLQATKRSIISYNQKSQQMDKTELTSLKDSLIQDIEPLVRKLEEVAVLDLSLDCLNGAVEAITSPKMDETEKAVQLTKISDYLDYLTLGKTEEEMVANTSKTISLSKKNRPSCETEGIEISVEHTTHHSLQTKLAEFAITLARSSEEVQKQTSYTEKIYKNPTSELSYSMRTLSSSLDVDAPHPIRTDENMKAVKKETEKLQPVPNTTLPKIKLNNVIDYCEPFDLDIDIALGQHLTYKLKTIVNSMISLLESYQKGDISKEEVLSYIDTFRELTLMLTQNLNRPHRAVSELKQAIILQGDHIRSVVERGPKV